MKFLVVLSLMLWPLQALPLLVSERGADPWLVSDGARLFYTQTTGSNIQIWVSDDIHAAASGTPTVVFDPPADTSFSRNLWAPELHHLNGTWYLYFAADDGKNENHRMYVLESTGGAAGPYEVKGKISAPGDDKWAIDGTVFEINGARYFVWSGWPGYSDGRQNLYISRMKNPWSLETPRVLISTPEYPWESWINEGPEFYRRQERNLLVFSANRSWTDDYAVGVLELVSDDPLDPDSWRKWPGPVIQSSSLPFPAYGPGHCSFFTDIEGTEWILYHSARRRGGGWDREIRAEKWPARFFRDSNAYVMAFGQGTLSGERGLAPPLPPFPFSTN